MTSCRLAIWAMCVAVAGVRGAAAAGGVRLIGAGMPCTGTQSMSKALPMLGYTAIHGIELLFNTTIRQAWDDWLHRGGDFQPALQTLLDNGIDATLDSPTNQAYLKLMQLYPEAKVILTVRDSPERWYESFASKNLKPGLVVDGMIRWICFYLDLHYDEYWLFLRRNQAVYGCSWYDEQTPELRQACTQGYTKHNEKVRQTVPAERLLEFNVKEGWGPLCQFLGVPVPEEPFPWRDITKDNGKFNWGFWFAPEAWQRLWVPLIALLWVPCTLCCTGCCYCCSRCRQRRYRPAGGSKEE